MGNKLRLGLIGCGGIAAYAHLPAYMAFNDIEIVSVCDIVPEKAKAAAKICGVAKIFTDYREMLRCADVDAVDICTPNYLHSIIAVDSFAAGKHVFCEKPDAVSVAEAMKMKEASERAGKLLMVMRNNRFTAGAQYLKRYVAAGKAGDIYAGRCGWIRRRGIPGRGGWFTTKEQSGGGPLIDLGVHMIDLAMYLMGNPQPVSVSGAIYNRFTNDDAMPDSIHSSFGETKANGVFDVEDLAMGFIRFGNGACLQVEFSWASNVKEERNFVELRGSRAGFTWEGGTVTLFGEENSELIDTMLRIEQTDNGHERNLRNFVDVLVNGADPCYKPQQGIDMIRILCGIYESAETGREVQL